MRRFVSILVLFLVLPAWPQSPNPQRLFEIGMEALTGGSPDTAKARDYIRRSAEVGYPPAEVMLGYFYETGTFVTQDTSLAMAWYKKAAQQDDPVGGWLLGRLILAGSGPSRDLNEASRWLQKSAAHDDPFGEYLLGRVKLERENYGEAAEWFRKAAAQGLPQAQRQLGLLLRQGQGVSQNKLEAYVWMAMSYDAGFQSASAANDLRQLEGELSLNQLDQAKSKAHELEQVDNRAVAARGCTGWAGEFNTIPTPPPPEIQVFCR